MDFTKDFLDDKAFRGQVLTFDAMPPQADAAGNLLRTGAFPKRNGDVLIRIFAPKAKTVNICINGKEQKPLKYQKDGVFEAIVAYDGAKTGPLTVDVLVDGALFLSPYLPICWNSDRPCNYIEVPDSALDFCTLRKVPHGAVRREAFHSAVMEGYEHCYVYTPAGYGKGDRDYPVLYLLHGTGDNETSWNQVGKMAYTLDNMLAEGKAEPFLVVMCNGMLRKGGVVNRQLDLAFETMLVDDVIPFVERTYRAKTDKWNRAIAGLSMGAYTTNDIVWHHPELFGWVGQFTASMVREPAWTDYDRPYADALKKLRPEDFAGLFQLFFRSTTPAEDHFEFFLADDAIYHYYGFDNAPCYKRTVYAGNTSKWNSWRMGFRDFAKLVFQPQDK